MTPKELKRMYSGFDENTIDNGVFNLTSSTN